jgi:hypothetical protein
LHERNARAGDRIEAADASNTSAALWPVAPSRISWLRPVRAIQGDWEPPSLRSAASLAVISDPDFGAASMTTVPAESPAMIRFR